MHKGRTSAVVGERARAHERAAERAVRVAARKAECARVCYCCCWQPALALPWRAPWLAQLPHAAPAPAEAEEEAQLVDAEDADSVVALIGDVDALVGDGDAPWVAQLGVAAAPAAHARPPLGAARRLNSRGARAAQLAQPVRTVLDDVEPVAGGGEASRARCTTVEAHLTHVVPVA